MYTTFLLAVASFGVTAQTHDFEWRGPVAQGRLIEIRGINGNIRAELSSSGEVEVVARSVGENGTSAPVNVKVTESELGMTVGAVTTADKGPGSRIDYFVRVPEGVNFLGRTVNGIVEADLLASDVEAYTVNGRVSIRTMGSAQARTVNGSINASLLNPSWKKQPAFDTVNGAITLVLPSNADTSLRASTRNGKISNGLTSLRGKVTDQSVNGKVGSGTCRSLIVTTVNGSIQLKRTS